MCCESLEVHGTEDDGGDSWSSLGPPGRPFFHATVKDQTSIRCFCRGRRVVACSLQGSCSNSGLRGGNDTERRTL